MKCTLASYFTISNNSTLLVLRTTPHHCPLITNKRKYAETTPIKLDAQNTQLMQDNTFIEDLNQTGVVAKLSSIPMFLAVLRSHPGVHAKYGVQERCLGESGSVKL